MQPFLVAGFLFFAVAMCIYDRQDKNNEPPGQHHDEKRLILPHD